MVRHGPDTAYAREVFLRETGFAPPPSIRELHGRQQWAGFGEDIAFIVFRFDDDEALSRIVLALRLEPVPAGEVAALRSFAGPPWWPAPEELGRCAEAFRHELSDDGQCYFRLWVDRARGKAFLQRADVG